MPIPITDLEVTEAGVTATLSFSRVSHRTYVPWHAVYAVTCTNGCGVMYREDMPADVALATPTDAAMMEVQLAGQDHKQSGYALSDDSPGLRVVPPEEDLGAGELAIHLHSRRRRPQLRVVK
jgi:stringent starvation protein B